MKTLAATMLTRRNYPLSLQDLETWALPEHDWYETDNGGYQLYSPVGAVPAHRVIESIEQDQRTGRVQSVMCWSHIGDSHDPTCVCVYAAAREYFGADGATITAGRVTTHHVDYTGCVDDIARSETECQRFLRWFASTCV